MTQRRRRWQGNQRRIWLQGDDRKRCGNLSDGASLGRVNEAFGPAGTEEKRRGDENGADSASH